MFWVILGYVHLVVLLYGVDNYLIINGYHGCPMVIMVVPWLSWLSHGYHGCPMVIMVVFGSARKAIHYMDINMAVYAIASVVISFAVAFVVAVCVELPFGNLEMTFFKIFGVGKRDSTRADTEAKGKDEAGGEAAQLKVKKYYN